MVDAKLGFPKIAIIDLVGDLAYIYDMWATNPNDEFFVEFLRENMRAHSLNRLVRVEKKRRRDDQKV